MWFKKKKTKEEKLKELNEELNILNQEHKSIINSYCMLDSYIFIFKGFSIKNDEIYINIVDDSTPKNLVNILPLWFYDLKYNKTIKESRTNWIIFRDKLDKIGLEIKLKK